SDGNTGMAIYRLKSRTAPHKANLESDYNRLQEAALNFKKQKALTDWMNKKRENTYVSIDEQYRSCEVLHTWFVN
ncbi:MAG TPA: peptidylprolyl isomerase, partial [Bacteroidia bacterium]|nr:peptidylprolyl isomerase [Bacteroidia bacterium]